MDWCHLDYLRIIVMFLSTDGTHSLPKSHWWASDVMLNSTKSVPIKKQTHLFAYCAQYTYSTAKIARDICNSEHIIYKKKIINSYCSKKLYKSHSGHSILNCTTSRHTTYHLNSSSSMEVCLCEYSIQKICILYSVDHVKSMIQMCILCTIYTAYYSPLK